MSVNSADIEQIVRQVIGQMQGGTSAPKKSGGPIPKTGRVAMLTELDGLNVDFVEFADKLKTAGRENGVEISVMHEDIFNTMHRI